MNNNIKVYVKTRDSLGRVVAEYYTQILKDRYEYLKLDAEDIDGCMVAIYDIEVDGELGWREVYL